GITRASQIPTRWIDQGARRALPIQRRWDRRRRTSRSSRPRWPMPNRTAASVRC
ncbi:DUF2797 domain-containing protein, partial [Pseudomonas aeruginosa]|nr:DUF2797 domain-containing protein [Pseudomonas aeruginosa]